MRQSLHLLQHSIDSGPDRGDLEGRASPANPVQAERSPTRRQERPGVKGVKQGPIMLRHPEYQYLDLMSHLLESGDRRIDRTGVGTLSTFGALLRFDLSHGSVPVLTTKQVYWKLAVK